MDNGEEDVLDKYRKQKIAQELQGIFKMAMGGFRENRTPIKTIAIKEGWKKLRDAVLETDKVHKETEKAHREAERRLKVARDLFWATIHSELNDMRDMEFKRESGEILVYEEEKPDEEEKESE